MLLLLTKGRKQKNSSNPFRIRIIISLSYWNWNDKHVHTIPWFPKKNRFQTQIGKVQTKTAQKFYPMGRHIPLYKGVLPPPGIKQKTLHLAVYLVGVTILDRIKWNSNPPSCPPPRPPQKNQRCLNGPHFHPWFGGREGLNVLAILSNFCRIFAWFSA